MTIDYYIRKIHDIVQTEEYDQYSYILKEYIDYLESLLKKEPENIKAICQLAIMYYEDCRENEDIISLLEDAIRKYENKMSTEELCEILNDLAYIYDKECYEPNKAILLLERAIILGTPFINTYYALSTLYLDVDLNKAQQMVLKILEYAPQNIEYKYQLGYCLLKKKDINQALNLFKQLAGDLDDLNELIEKIHFCYAFALLSLGKKREASIIADDLYMKYRFGNTKVIGVFELMDLYYSLEEYQKVNKMFEDKYRDSNGNEYSLSFFGEEIQVILYTLHTLGFNEKCKVVFESKIQEIKDTIENYETDDIYSKEIIAYFENEMLELKNGYYSIIDFDKRPEISDITKNLKVEPYCYLIDCPRHINNFK